MSTQSVDIFAYLNAMTPEAHGALRVLAANLGLHRNNETLRVILVTSYHPGEGKTTVAVNLAIVAAKSGKRVLYVDADLRKPLQLKRYGAYATKGLTDCSETRGGEEILCHTSIEALKFVTVGTQLVDPDEFLGSEVFERFIKDAANRYDLVLIDSPALENYLDGAIIAAKASGVLMVTSSQKTTYKDLERMTSQMKKVGATIVGIVLNQFNRRKVKPSVSVVKTANLLSGSSQPRNHNL